ncbi:MAG: DUF2156 domain-containing protein [Clostridia bacterium]|nr:DUF2156 domain-containing protein [Clostridia bacterium]
MNSTLPQTLSWQRITPQLQQEYQRIFQQAPGRAADRSFANLYLWSDTYHASIAFAENRIFVRFSANGTGFSYLFPLGSGDLDTALSAIREECMAAGTPFTLVGVTEEELTLLQKSKHPILAVDEARDMADYLYDATSLATLSGKKLHAKRNHINAFSAQNNWSIRPLTAQDAPLCREILAAWSAERESDSTAAEQAAIERAFGAFDTLLLEGALLAVDGTPVAFTVGSMTTPDTLDVHFEKALPTANGAFPTINREFVRMMQAKFPTLQWINREDDMGLENLRRAKLSYRPALLLHKHRVVMA